jgi:uncharacterized protein
VAHEFELQTANHKRGDLMQVLGIDKPLIGVVHLLPLPGAPGYSGSMKKIETRAMTDAATYLEGGMDGILVENFGDSPFFPDSVPPETIAAMSVIASRLRDLGTFPIGVNVLRNDGAAALAIAESCGAEFIRVNVLATPMITDQGIITGCAAELMRKRRLLNSDVDVWADLLVKHASPLAPIDPPAAAKDMVERSMATALILTGSRTGTSVEASLLERMRKPLRSTPLIIGSGTNARNLADYLRLADGFLVGTALKKNGRTTSAVDPVRVEKLVAARNQARLAPGKRS